MFIDSCSPKPFRAAVVQNRPYILHNNPLTVVSKLYLLMPILYRSNGLIQKVDCTDSPDGQFKLLITVGFKKTNKQTEKNYFLACTFNLVLAL